MQVDFQDETSFLHQVFPDKDKALICRGAGIIRRVSELESY